MRRIIVAFRLFFRERFTLDEDKNNEAEIVNAIRRTVAFKGVNLWMLIFAILIASVGLNVNSTAVVIGAMLISPLMGPLMGLGLGAGINDLELVSKAAKNLFIAVIISVITSAIYFYLTPITEAQSELLSRTSPTFWDVLIALSGGLAGVFAGSSKEKGNVIPGVAIATALMPPLCTAGYGLATFNLQYFFGALYLFFINSVMIGASTYIVVQFLDFKKAEYLDAKKDKMVKRIIYAIVFFTVTPSIYFGYNIVKKSTFELQAKQFIQNEFSNESYYVVKQNLVYHNRGGNEIDIYIGGYMDSTEIRAKKNRLENYNLGNNAVLNIKQGRQLLDIVNQDQKEKDKLVLQHAKELNLKDSTISILSEEMLLKEKRYYATSKIAKELSAFYPEIINLSISESDMYNEVDSSTTKMKMVYLGLNKDIEKEDEATISTWLKARLSTSKVKLILEREDIVKE